MDQTPKSRDHAPAGTPVFVTTEFADGCLTVRPVGPRMGDREVSIIAQAVNRRLAAVRSPLRSLVLDLSAVRVMSSLGLGLCIDLRNRAAARGASTWLRGLDDELDALFRVMKLDRLYRMTGDESKLPRAA